MEVLMLSGVGSAAAGAAFVTDPLGMPMRRRG
jgi:hypothetical protein